MVLRALLQLSCIILLLNQLTFPWRTDYTEKYIPRFNGQPFACTNWKLSNQNANAVGLYFDTVFVSNYSQNSGTICIIYAQSVISIENVTASVKATKRDACKNHVNFYFNWYSHFPLNTHSFNIKETETQQEPIKPAAVLTSKFIGGKRPYFLTCSPLSEKNSFFRRITVSLILGDTMALTSGSSRRCKAFFVHPVMLHNVPIQFPLFIRMFSFWSNNILYRWMDRYSSFIFLICMKALLLSLFFLFFFFYNKKVLWLLVIISKFSRKCCSFLTIVLY